MYLVDDFLNLPDKEVTNIVQETGKPVSGVFVPNGNRRLVLTKTYYQSNEQHYIRSYIDHLKENAMNSIQLFFKYMLKNLIIPMFSISVLNREKYFRNVLIELIQVLFGSYQYLDLYEKLQVSIRVYGDLNILKEMALWKSYDLIIKCIECTSSYDNRKLFFGIGSNDELGADLMESGIQFFEKNGRTPTLTEQKEFYYSYNIPEVDFVILSSSLKAHGIPPLICGKTTNLYFLPSPSVLGFNDITYRKIIYDILYCRSNVNIDFSNLGFQRKAIEDLHERYEREKTNVFGIGEKIGPFWVLRNVN